MDKLWLIIQREFLTRVKSKSFLLSTFLTPLAFLVFFVIAGFIMSYKEGEDKKVVVSDPANLLDKVIKDESNIYYTFSDESIDNLKKQVEQGNYSGILEIPKPDSAAIRQLKVYYYSENQLGLDDQAALENQLEDRIGEYKLKAQGLDKSILENLKTNISIDPEPINASQKNESSSAAAIGAALGTIMGIIMYMSVFIYGSMVMRSVMEEKMSRIVEVMISTVKPFQLMMGKIIGVGAVGLTQFILWMILIPLISMFVTMVFGFDPQQMQSQAMTGAQSVDPDDLQMMVSKIFIEVNNMNWWLIIPSFIFYFLCGYILYSSLFAAVGSAVGDDLGESQSLTLPITIPVLLAFYIMFAAVRAPQSSMAVFGSIFPLFSPIVMPSRIVFDVPAWEIAVSMLLLLVTTIFMVWLAGRIYRVGILMYGKKASFKELRKRMFYKD
ncbi:MAG TPA: ABC transporter permease [Saprospiraceae bacterium]|nr:ABC transporter permease [Saprospiraceae bacterium]